MADQQQVEQQRQTLDDRAKMTECVDKSGGKVATFYGYGKWSQGRRALGLCPRPRPTPTSLAPLGNVSYRVSPRGVESTLGQNGCEGERSDPLPMDKEKWLAVINRLRTEPGVKNTKPTTQLEVKTILNRIQSPQPTFTSTSTG